MAPLSPNKGLMSSQSVELTTYQDEKVFQPIKVIFSDFVSFETLVAGKLKEAIAKAEALPLDKTTSFRIAETYYNKKDFVSANSAKVWKLVKTIFQSAYALILFYREKMKQHQRRGSTKKPVKSLIYDKTDELLRDYPAFFYVEMEELDLLLKFRNFCKVLTQFIPPLYNKQVYLDVCGRLEGTKRSYVTGTGMREAVRRRVLIYETEGGVSAEIRPVRAPPSLFFLSRKKTVKPASPPKLTPQRKFKRDITAQAARQPFAPSDKSPPQAVNNNPIAITSKNRNTNTSQRKKPKLVAEPVAVSVPVIEPLFTVEETSAESHSRADTAVDARGTALRRQEKYPGTGTGTGNPRKPARASRSAVCDVQQQYVNQLLVAPVEGDVDNEFYAIELACANLRPIFLPSAPAGSSLRNAFDV